VAGTLSKQLEKIGEEGPLVSILVEPGADRARLESFLEEGFLDSERGGHYKAQGLAEKLAPIGAEELAPAIIEGSPQRLQGNQAGVTEAHAKRLVEAVVPFEHDADADVTVPTSELAELLLLQEQPVDDMVRILSDGKPVDQLSPGGRSSAMLPLIALSDTAPLIIDQPEDNLDNRMVGNTLSSILAHLKERRQIIVTTHNPNIVVGGDAEQVAVLRAIDDRSAELELTGNIDDEDVIDAVIKIMEGGREAFEARERRYERHLG